MSGFVDETIEGKNGDGGNLTSRETALFVRNHNNEDDGVNSQQSMVGQAFNSTQESSSSSPTTKL
jgi:hypothetical protein